MNTLRNPTTQNENPKGEVIGGSFFRDLPDEALRAFESIKIHTNYPRGAALFVEGESAHGIYALCHGRVKLLTHSADGKALILRIAEPGELLGLSATITGSSHEATAEVLENCQVNFVRGQDFLRFIREHADAGLGALRQLSENYHQAYAQICSLGLSTSVADKLAKLFLSWCSYPATYTGFKGKSSSVRLKLSFSHEEIAEMIGTSRETVTRMLKDFKERGLISIKGSDLTIHDRGVLESSIGSRGRPSV
jgi:CRP/FNR family transcriptional regulator, cyclic AMP receptor protein